MEDAEPQRPVAAVEAERPPRGATLPHRLVDHEVVAVETLERGHATLGQVGEHPSVELAGALPAAGRAGREPHDVVRGVRRERGDDALDVVGRLEAEVLVDLAVHLLRGQRHGGRSCDLCTLMRLSSHVKPRDPSPHEGDLGPRPDLPAPVKPQEPTAVAVARANHGQTEGAANQPPSPWKACMRSCPPRPE